MKTIKKYNYFSFLLTYYMYQEFDDCLDKCFVPDAADIEQQKS